MHYSIILYRNDAGKEPFVEWLEGLRDMETRARIKRRLDRIAHGNFGDAKSLGDGVHELRLDFGSGYRIYYGMEGKQIVILLSGGEKASQKKDIKKAKEYWYDYQEK